MPFEVDEVLFGKGWEGNPQHDITVCAIVYIKSFIYKSQTLM